MPKISALDDVLHPFLIDHSHIRGQMARINGVVNGIMARHDYPHPVSQLLGEMLVVAALLVSNLKSEGILTLQAKGEGPVRFIVVDASHQGALRGYAEMEEGAIVQLSKMRLGKTATLKKLLGKGYLALTLDHGAKGRYQGIVDLSEHSIAEAVREYFTQSQQVEVAVKICVKGVASKGKKRLWQAGGIMIERMPEEGGIAPEEKPKRKTSVAKKKKLTEEDPWARIRLFMETVTEKELTSPGLSTWQVLERLFGEDGVWAYPPREVKNECRCSRRKVSGVLATIPKEELKSLAVDNEISVNCQFCNETQIFTMKQLDRL